MLFEGLRALMVAGRSACTNKRNQPPPRAACRGQFECLEDRVLLSVAPEEQMFVYLLNRARHDPVAYQEEQQLLVNFSYVTPRAPLAINEKLIASSELHATEMATYNYIAHQSKITGAWPNKMARDQGYVLPSWWSSDANYIESLMAGNLSDTAEEALNALLVDTGVSPPGHRNHLLGIDFYADNREIGVGKAYNLAALYDHYWAIHATWSDPADRFLTGVIFEDFNGNGRYDRSEGLSGVTISAGSLSTTTNEQGGWSLEVNDGEYDVTAAGGALSGTASVPVTVSGSSVEVDFVSGLATGYVNFELVVTPPLPLQDLPVVQMIDDGDPGYHEAGRWTQSTSRGHRRDYDHSRKGTGADRTTWTFPVNPGTYQVSTSWAASSIFATNAPFTVYDVDPVSGTMTPLGTATLNQRIGPDDLTDMQGNRWEWLGMQGNSGVFQLRGRMLVVELSDNADGTVVADAVRIERLPDAAEIVVMSGTTNVLDGSTIDVGAMLPGAPIERTWMVRNLGATVLTLGRPTLAPVDSGGTTAGFELLVPASFKESLAPGEATTFTLRMLAAVEASFSARLSLENDDADESPFEVILLGQVSYISWQA